MVGRTCRHLSSSRVSCLRVGLCGPFLISSRLSDDDALGESELFSHKRDFTSAFPNPVQKTILKESIEWYLVKVQKDADTLKMIFPT
jgi:hypothetical protein